MVSLPDELVRDIDVEARRRSTSRSALLAAAARRELARRDPEAVAEAIARSERRFRGAGAFDAAELVRRSEIAECDDAAGRHLGPGQVVSQRRRARGRRGSCARDAARRGDVEGRVIDLALYEMGNVLLRSLGWAGSDVADQLDDLVLICGPPLAMAAEWLRQAAAIGAQHQLTSTTRHGRPRPWLSASHWSVPTPACSTPGSPNLPPQPSNACDCPSKLERSRLFRGRGATP